MTEPELHHRSRRMTGRDPDERHRVASPLELLFDLTFVVAFGTAANELAHGLVTDHVVGGIVGFVFATFAIAWAWLNFTWFASAFDTDDWVYRLTTMLQMGGVLVLALGLPAMFSSLHGGDTLDNDVMVWGYVVMRVAMLLQWWRVSRHSPEHRGTAQSYLVSIGVAQVLWIVLALVDLPVGATFAAMAVPLLVEVAGPVYAERVRGATPWHAHHVAERYGLMVIIALGEGMIGTMATLTALTGDGLSVDVALLAVAGIGLAFGMWWIYFVVPFADLLHARRERSFGFGYGHLVLVGAIVAVGAGQHAGAYFLEHHSELGEVATILTVVAPVALYVVVLFASYSAMTRSVDRFHVLLVALTAVVFVAALALAAAEVTVAWCLVVVALAPWVSVVGYELRGYRHDADVVAGLHHD